MWEVCLLYLLPSSLATKRFLLFCLLVPVLCALRVERILLEFHARVKTSFSSSVSFYFSSSFSSSSVRGLNGSVLRVLRVERIPLNFHE